MLYPLIALQLADIATTHYALPECCGDARLLRHEQAHWRQYQRMGVLKFYAVYLWYSLKYGYRNNPMEIEAREAERLS
jgi:hypothetical protein